jgi:hypothetical protein
MNSGNNGVPPNSNMGGNRPRSAISLRHQTFDSNGPDLRVRGNAWQVYEKYQSLARDASGSGDRVAAENYQQHAEHYYRIIEAINEATAAEQPNAPRAGGNTYYGQQPEMPTNYYSPEGNLMPAGNPDAPVPNADPSQQPQMPQAEVQMRNQPPAPNPFFPPEDTDGNSGPVESLVANR